MDRAEAIFYIKELQKTYASMDKKVAEAVDMAIEALREPETLWEQGMRSFDGLEKVLVNRGDAESATTTDCISRQQAVEALCDKCVYGRHECGGNCEDVVTVLRNLPPVTPPERTGEWIDRGDYAVCSRCAGTSWQQMNGVEIIPFKSKYCPYCGAKMGGDTE